MTRCAVASFPRYGALGASSRVRWLQFLPELRRCGLQVSVSSLLDDEYLRRKYAGESIAGPVAAAYARRALAAWAGRRAAAVIWVEKELWPWAPAWLERQVLARRPYVVDYDDAIFHNYDLHPNAWVRRLLGQKIDTLMRGAAIVTAGNQYLAERARRAGARRVEILPTVVDLRRYTPSTRKSAGDEPLVIGWIGSPATSGYLRQLAEPLAELARRRRIVLRVIGAAVDLPGVPVQSVAWTEAGEAQALAQIDVGLMPLPDSPWERGKCGYKLVQYMACGLPVIASPVGANVDIVQPGVNGFLAADDAQWVQALTRLADDPALRHEFGQRGRAQVESRFSLQVAAPRLATWLNELCPAARASSAARNGA